MVRNLNEAQATGSPVKAYDPFATFHCVFQVVGAKKGSIITASWTNGAGFSQTTTATIPKDGDSNLNVNLAPPSGAWTMGTYTLSLAVDGKIEQEVRFEVAATPR
jgi:hypothetical protein